MSNATSYHVEATGDASVDSRATANRKNKRAKAKLRAHFSQKMSHRVIDSESCKGFREQLTESFNEKK